MDSEILINELMDLAEQLSDAQAAQDMAGAIENVRRQLEDLANDVRRGVSG